MQEAQSVSVKKKRKGLTLKAQRNLIGYLFVLPALLIFCIFVLIPLIMSVYLSFFESDMFFLSMEYVGFDNFAQVFQDSLYWTSILNILCYTLMAVPMNIILSMILALLVNSDRRGVKAYRFLFYLPSVTSTVAASTVWLWMMNTSYGLLNDIFALFGLPGGTWLTHSSTALVSVTLVTVWQGVGANMIIFVAALQNMPTQVYEAAKLDGAGPLTIFFRITFPLIAPTMYFILTMTLIGAFQLYDHIYVLTSGGPANATLTPVYLIWQNSFGTNAGRQAGYAAAQAFVLFLIIMIVNLLIRRLDKKVNG